MERTISIIGAELKGAQEEYRAIRDAWQGNEKNMPAGLGSRAYELRGKITTLKSEFASETDRRNQFNGSYGADMDSELLQDLGSGRAANALKAGGKFSPDTLRATAHGARYRVPDFNKLAYTGHLSNVPNGRSDIAAMFGAWAYGFLSSDMRVREACHSILRNNGIEAYSQPNAEWDKFTQKSFRALSEGINNLGGFLVPIEFSNIIIDLREYAGVIRKYAKIMPMSSDSLQIPRRKTGIQLPAYFVGENNPLTESVKNWQNVSLNAKKAVVATRYSIELSQDALINIGDDLIGEIPYSFSWLEDVCGFFGDGTSTFSGIIGAIQRLAGQQGEITNTGTGSHGWANILLADLEQVAASTAAYPGFEGTWFCNKTFYYQVLVKLMLQAGGVYAAEVQAGLRESKPNMGRFLGEDVQFSQVFPNVTPGSSTSVVYNYNGPVSASQTYNNPIMYGDLEFSTTIGDRKGIVIAQSTEASDTFLNDQAILKGTQRFDVNTHDWGGASGSNMFGPIASLKVTY